ncbi:microfibrillar-associated protein 1-like protein [Leptotrombidium deliense]|uniref:Microfibrillar-associated protein 1-like protein n=1 Tax=Leptotrombidium deliense TaxID=299467 RepID=A0A443SIG8_9ACAR|nr:microfibrillar-associated protein 1-like protein [Leptotrombidium deliense]
MSNVALSTAGAVSVLNEKGEISMQKVKVQRYVSGRKPKYAQEASSESDDSDGEFINERKIKNDEKDRPEIEIQAPPVIHIPEDVVKSDRRLQRLRRREHDVNERSIRQIVEPEIVAFGDKDAEIERRRPRRDADSDDSEREEIEEETVERRHAALRQRRDFQEEELLGREDELQSEEEEEESEYEEYTDSEEDALPRLKPVFVRKKDRLIIKDREKEDMKVREKEIEAKYMAEERRRQALKIIEEENRRELQEKEDKEDEQLLASIAAINTDDENEEAAYETWKLRELKRVKRDKDEREALLKEKMDVERIHAMTEEERQAEFRNNPKLVTNKQAKGKYRYLQKYFHRGAFFLDEEDEVFKRDFAEPTLEDHFDKTVLPKVMQVKNFGRSGRTKYTHLVDQDTTAFDSPWSAESAQTSKFHSTQAGGMKQVFEKPTKKRK